MSDVRKAVAWCHHPDCLDPSKEDAARLNVTPRPMGFLSAQALYDHALEKHGVSPEDFGPPIIGGLP